MQVSVVETLENGASFRFTVIFGRTAENEMAAAELLEYKPKNSQDYFMVLPKSAQLSVDEKQLLRGTFKESMVNSDYEHVFDMSLTKLFKIRSDAWIKAETVLEYIENR
ncbi:MAG: hypothetical protein KBT36_01520 [Kurthia sp.]|nr:hypothetical protein [Candidatus Kurthia equi]